ncbi:hypothetical protein MGG_17881 [Pyricularia oryzae 70-15]|uniref:Uncharacterized protein n=1 Tax=Pyricularia oryzae (strain 70-15 / ATCC MYA-4617 / FGSC 8958) TaxID=242507 RepID=G4NKS6_PYRO7|nr:uncharacterized protein MGG_17881 [Pyricularia oryzae 70-15]EHA45904.1 hypothetical protein MGG_17881 [Pyricularia oryzae 70-15]
MSSLTVNANVPKENPIIQATFWNLRKAHLNWHHTEGRCAYCQKLLCNCRCIVLIFSRASLREHLARNPAGTGLEVFLHGTEQLPWR